MKCASAKQKGRKFQQWVRDQLITRFGFSKDDCRSTSMGAGGEDVQLSSSAQRKFPYVIECKNTEKLNVWAAYEQAESHCKPPNIAANPVLFIKKNGKTPLAVVDAEQFLNLVYQQYHREIDFDD